MWSIRLAIVAAAAFAICAAGWLLYAAGQKAGRQEVQQMWDQERAATAEAHAQEMMRARQQESALRDLAEKLRKEKANEARRLAREYAADIGRLRDRPARDSVADVSGASAAGAGPTPGCTGAQLFREDSAVLVGIARDADELRLALKQCQAAYNSVRAEFAPELPRD